jgi:pimeloyl-ACP methyl ester carboxylesterase
LVIHGADDVAIDIANAQVLANGLVGCDGLITVPGAHAANLTHPQAVNAAIVQFLSSLPD